MSREVGIENGATGGDGTLLEKGTEVGDEELHRLWGLGKGVEGWGRLNGDCGNIFINHCDEFVPGSIEVGESAIVLH